MDTVKQRTYPHRRRVLTGALALSVAAGALVWPVAASAEEPAPTLADTPVITAETTWRYLDDGTDPAAGLDALRAWTAPEFDDGAWKSGVGGFGAKRGALEDIGPNPTRTLLNHYLDGTAPPAVPTYFFRTGFELEAGSSEQISSLRGELIYDDGATVWVNGKRVAGFDDERATGTSNQEYAGAGKTDPLRGELTVPGDVLVDGENTIAVALYQDRETSSDIYFHLPELRIVTDEPEETSEPPTRIVLTPGPDTATTQAVSWLAGHTADTSGEVQIATAAGGAVRTIAAYDAGTSNNNPRRHFSATVTGLTPNTEYRYRVGSADSWSEWQTFRTADPDATEFQYLYYGDAQIGLDSTWPAVVAAAEAKAPRAIGSVHAGDLIDTASNDTQWNNWFAGMEHSAATTTVLAAPGNHEYSGDALMRSWKAHFEYRENGPTLATIGDLAKRAEGDSDAARQYAAYFAHWEEFARETVYFADYGSVRFIALNATRNSTFLTPAQLPACSGDECPSAKASELWIEYQAAWLDRVLETSPKTWNVVTFHQPVFSTSAGRDEPVLRKHWVPVFQKHDIDLVQMGHDHTYARGYVNTDATDTEGMTSGPVYTVANSGAKHYSLESDARNVWTLNGATQVKRGQGVTTYQVVTVGKDTLHYASYLVEVNERYSNTTLKPGDLYDEFTITKYDDGAKYVTEPGVEAPAPEGDGGEGDGSDGGGADGSDGDPDGGDGTAPGDGSDENGSSNGSGSGSDTGSGGDERPGADTGSGSPAGGDPTGTAGAGTQPLAVTGDSALPIIGAAAVSLLLAGAALIAARRWTRKV